MIPVTLFLVLAAGAMLLLRRSGTGSVQRTGNARRTSAARRRVATGPARENPHRSVTICASASACPAALAMARADQRVLLSEAPQLPLVGCDVTRCKCRYQHHEDRRAGDDDRRVPGRLRAELYVESGQRERRNRNRGRRLTDRAGA